MKSRECARPHEEYSFDLEDRLVRLFEEKGIDVSCKEALRHAVSLHKDQKPRPDGPYVDHVLRVTLRLVEAYGVSDPELVIAALLHDAVEDQSAKLAPRGTREDAVQVIARRYGERVGRIVQALSVPQRKKGTTRVERNEAYRAHVKEIIEDPAVAIIKLSDFSDNALRLAEIKDLGRRRRMTEKYLPVMGDFIERLQRGDLPLDPEKQREIFETLEQAKQECELFLAL
jgi:(p)ppGpp synthase/HD superfamily hydrolase